MNTRQLVISALLVLLLVSVFRESLFGSVAPDKRIWFEITLLLLGALLAERLVGVVKQPSVMVLLLIGVAFSPSFVNLVAGALGIAAPKLILAEGTVLVFAKLGSILLLFAIGLESEVHRIFNWKNLAIAIGGVILPFLGGLAWAEFTGGSFLHGMFVGAALTATSVGVTVAMLAELGMLEREFAKMIIGAAVIDDILGLMVLSFVENIPSELTITGLEPLGQTVAVALLFVGGGLVIGELIVKRWFSWPAEQRLFNKTLLKSLSFLFLYAYAAEFIGLSAIVGAFLAGVTLNRSRWAKEIGEAIYPIQVLFTPVFFVSLGLFVDVGVLAANLPAVIGLTALAIVTKVVGVGAVAKLVGASAKDAAIVGIGMVPRGEIALIIALFGLTTIVGGQPILSAAEYTTISAMAFLTTLLAPVLLAPLLRQQAVSGKA